MGSFSITHWLIFGVFVYVIYRIIAGRAKAPQQRVPRGGSGGLRGVVTIIAGVVMVSCIAALGGGNRDGKPVPPGEQARGACSLFIERAAHDPGSVAWVDYPQWTMVQTGADTWEVSARYRAKNRLGALQQSSVRCVVQKSGDEWRLVRLQ